VPKNIRGNLRTTKKKTRFFGDTFFVFFVNLLTTMKRKSTSGATKSEQIKKHKISGYSQELDILSLPSDVLCTIGEKFDNINYILNYDRTCKKIHSAMDLSSFWTRLIDSWFGPSQQLVERFGKVSHTIMYEHNLLSKSGLYDYKTNKPLFDKRKFNELIKIKYIFHSYFVELKEAITRSIRTALTYEKLDEFQRCEMPSKIIFDLCPPRLSTTGQYSTWLFKFNALGKIWDGYATLFLNGDWIVTSVPVTIQQITEILYNFASYIRDNELAKWIIPSGVDFRQFDAQEFLALTSAQLYSFWPFQKGPQNVMHKYPHLVFVLMLEHDYCFQIYTLGNISNVQIFHVDPFEWNS